MMTIACCKSVRKHDNDRKEYSGEEVNSILIPSTAFNE
jgi:hypothetical protein